MADHGSYFLKVRVLNFTRQFFGWLLMMIFEKGSQR